LNHEAIGRYSAATASRRKRVVLVAAVDADAAATTVAVAADVVDATNSLY
jgi:hypothetical protein